VTAASGGVLDAAEPRPTRPLGSRGRPPLSCWLLAVAVAVAFADASIVVLAVPDLLAQFDSAVGTASWVVTGYNVAVVVATWPTLAVLRRYGPGVTTLTGVLVFLAASLGCAGSSSLELLITLRAVQGVGAAFLLAGSLPLLARLTGSQGAGLAVWSAAAAIGAALGPAAGGALTEGFSWRSIFLAQAPLAAAAMLALPRAWRTPDPAPAALGQGQGPRLPRLRVAGAHLGLALVSAALVGALFLVVILMINGWGASPLTAAAFASALPIGTLAARPLARGRSVRQVTAAGCLTVASGLAALALLPDRGWAVAGAALAVIGLGLGLAVPTFTDASVPHGPRLGRDGALSVAGRHAGLVLALAVVTPLLAANLGSATRRAILVGSDDLLRAPVSLKTKIALAKGAGEAVGHTPAGQLPDLRPTFAKAAPDGRLDGLRDRVSDTITAAVTRGFRPSFALCALFAVLALVPVVLLTRERSHDVARAPPGRPRPVLLALSPVLAVALAAGTLVGGGRDPLRLPDSCKEQPALARGGVDSFTQQIALDALDGAACRLHTTGVALLLTLLPDNGQPRLTLTNGQLSPAVRDGLQRAVQRQVDEGDIPGFAAAALRFAIRHAPVDWLVGVLRQE
jgi:predicted MFS family arabinose efflux permease